MLAELSGSLDGNQESSTCWTKEPGDRGSPFHSLTLVYVPSDSYNRYRLIVLSYLDDEYIVSFVSLTRCMYLGCDVGGVAIGMRIKKGIWVSTTAKNSIMGDGDKTEKCVQPYLYFQVNS